MIAGVSNTLRERYVPRAYLEHHPIRPISAKGAEIQADDGRTYLDFAGGIAATNIGHSHPKVVAAVAEQASKFLHSGPVMIHSGYLELAARLAELAPGPGDKQVLFVNSGAEGIENAVKLARHATGRSAVIAFERGFHGRTLLGSSLTGSVSPYKAQPTSMSGDIFHAPFPYPYRPPVGVAPENLTAFCLDALQQLTLTQVPSSRVAAVLVEPIQGEGGYVVPSAGFLSQLQAWTNSIGALLIVDEIQTGYGRTGTMWASDRFEIAPDILVVGKSIACGLPLAAVIARTDLFDRIAAGDIGGTYGGNPVATAAALAVLDVFSSEPWQESALQIESSARDVLGRAYEEIALMGEVRGVGSMIGVELVRNRETKIPAPEVTRRVIDRARERGLILIRTGIFGNVLRILPPLLVDEESLLRGLGIISDALQSVANEIPSEEE